MTFSWKKVDGKVKFDQPPATIPGRVFTNLAPTKYEQAYWLARHAYASPYEAIVITAQWAIESALGQSEKAKTLNNFHGIKKHRDYVGIEQKTSEYVNNEIFGVTSSFIAYYSPWDGFYGRYVFTRQNPRYGRFGYLVAVDNNNPEQMVQSLYDAGYASDPNYKVKIMKHVEFIFGTSFFQKDVKEDQLEIAEHEPLTNKISQLTLADQAAIRNHASAILQILDKL